MTNKEVIKVLRRYQASSDQQRQEFLHAFEVKMLYRTTKTENPQTTKRMVREVLSREADIGDYGKLERLIEEAVDEAVRELP